MTQRQKLTLSIVLLVCLFGLGSASLVLLRGELQAGVEHVPGAVQPLAGSSDSDGRIRLDAASLRVKTARLDSLQPRSMPQRFAGILTARRSSRLAAKHLGLVNHIHVELGDKVRAGQVLVELDDRELRAEREVLLSQMASAQARLEELGRGPRPQEIEQAEALVRELEATLKLRRSSSQRLDALVTTSSVSKQEHDESLTAVEATEAQLVNAQKSLELLREGTRREQILAQEATVRSLQFQVEKFSVLISDQQIVAPFDGHVQTRLIDEGVIVTPGQPILEIVESGRLEVHVGLPSGLATPQIYLNRIDLEQTLGNGLCCHG